jgi:glucokinase
MTLTLGIDVGGTKIASVLLNNHGNVLEQSVISTDGDGTSVIAQIWNLIEHGAARHSLEGVGVAVPGTVDPKAGTVISAPNIHWNHVDLQALIEPALHGSAQVIVANDANAAAWAEYRFGGHTPGDSFAMITVGTGIGSGFIINDRIVNGATGAAGEVGHLTLVEDGEACSCVSQGCWERYASGNALQRAAIHSGWGPDRASYQLLDAVGTHPRAKEVLATTARHLIRGMDLMASVLDPTVIVLGGGLGTDPLFFDTVAAHHQALSIKPPRSRPRLAKAHLGPLAGAIGAADLARRS